MSGSGVDGKTGAPQWVRIAKAMADPLRIKILVELSMRDMSATQFYERFGGGSVSRVDRHFKVLLEYGWLVKVGEKRGGKRRGSVEHFYRAPRPAVLFDNASWSSLPESIQNSISSQWPSTVGERVFEAIAAGTLDGRNDRHLSWVPLSIDQRGWDNILARVDSLFEFLFEEQERAKLRMTESGEEPIPMTVALAAFESPKEDGPKAP